MAPDHEHGDGCGCSDGTGRRGFMAGCGAAMAFALAGTSPAAVAGQPEGKGKSPVEKLLRGSPKDWGRWNGGGDGKDELGRLNLLGSEEAFRGMTTVTQYGDDGIERFTLQLSMTGEVINPEREGEPDPDIIFPPSDPDENDPQFPSTDTGDPAFPPRTPARRDNTTPSGGAPGGGGTAFVDDKWATDFFLQGTTHLDALGHAWYGDKIYNGFQVETTEEEKEFETPLLGSQGIDANPNTEQDGDTLSEVTTTRGLGKADISQAAGSGIAGRGVLLDVGRHLDRVSDDDGRLPLGHEVTYEDLMATADAQGTEIQERDILLVRTGAVERTRDDSAEWAPLNEPGLVYSEELVDWFADMDIPYVGADNLGVEKVVQTIEVEGYEDPQTIVIPLHGALLRNLGIYINEILDLKALGEACAEDGIYEFLFTAAPLNVERGSGAPINPVVLKATDPGNGGGNGNGGNGKGK